MKTPGIDFQSSGTARIHIRSTSVGRLVADKFLDIIDPNIRL